MESKQANSNYKIFNYIIFFSGTATTSNPADGKKMDYKSK